MGTNMPAQMRAIAAVRELAALLPSIADDAARARENSEIIRQELKPDTK